MTQESSSFGAPGLSGELVAVCTSSGKGTPKQRARDARAIRGHGIDGDAHAGGWHRQVSLLADEQVDVMRKSLGALKPGAFGENLVTRGIDLDQLQVGQRLRVGDAHGGVVLQLTQRGKICHDRCAIYHRTGDCIMPRHGIFARILRGGVLAAGMPVATDAELDRQRYAVITLSDSRAQQGHAETMADTAGDAACALLDEGLPAGLLVSRRLLADDRSAIERAIVQLCDEEVCDLVVTTGGTGLSPRDVTPEATRAVIDREIPGLAEAMRAAGLSKTPRAMLSRAVCGTRGSTIVINLSGSERAVREQLAAILPALPHAIRVAGGAPQECAR